MIKIWCFLIIGSIHVLSLKYANIKPIEQRCNMVNKNDCKEDTIMFNFIFCHDKVAYSFKYERSKETKSLRNINEYHSFLNSECQIIFIQEYYDGEYNNIIDIKIVDIEDKLIIFMSNSNSMFLIKIKICSHNDIHINVFMFAINKFITTDSIIYKGPNPDNNLRVIYYNEVDAKYSSYLCLKTRQFMCINKDINICKENFLKLYPFEYKNEIVKINNAILNKYYLFSNAQISDEKINFVYKFKSIPSDISTEYPLLDDSFFILNEPNIKQCTYHDIEGLLNIQCICKDGYYGIDCSHKYHCSSCSEGYCSKYNQCSKCKAGWKGPTCFEFDIKLLNICGLHGDLFINGTGRFCNCHEEWKGKLCSYSLTEKTTIRILFNLVSTTNYDDAKNSKIKIVIGAVIASITVILAIIGVIIFIVKMNS